MVNVNYTNRDNEYEQFLGSPRIVVQNFWKRIHQLTQETTFRVETPRGKIYSKPFEHKKLVFTYIHDLEKALEKPNYDPEAENAIVFKGQVDIGVDLMLAIEQIFLVGVDFHQYSKIYFLGVNVTSLQRPVTPNMVQMESAGSFHSPPCNAI